MAVEVRNTSFNNRWDRRRVLAIHPGD